MLKGPSQQFGKSGSPLAWLQPLQTGYGRQTTGYLSCILYFCESGKEQANSSYAAGAGKGQDNDRGHYLL